MSLTRIFAIGLRHYFLTIHHLERFADLFIFPVVGLIMFGFLANFVKVQSSGLAAFFLGGVILWVIFERVGTAVGIDFMYEIWERNLVNILASPITTVEFVTSLVLISLTKVFISFSAMFLIALFFYQFNIFALGFSLVFFWVNLLLFAVSLGIFNIGIITRWGHSAGPLTWVLPFAIQPLAAVFYPVSILPEFVQKIAWFLPLSHVFQGMRYTFANGSFNSGEFLAAFGLNVVYFTFAVGFFSLMFKLSKKRGTLAKL